MRNRIAALAVVLVAGCGDQGPPPEQQVRETVAAFGRATAEKDYRALCERILAPSLIEEVRAIGLPCEAALRQGLGEVEDPRLTIGRVRVEGRRATAEVRSVARGQAPSQDTLRLEDVNGTWKISSLGS